MKKFVTAYINFYDHKLIQEIVEARSELEALIMLMMQGGYTFEEDDENITIESIKVLAFDGDSMISAIEI